MGFGTYMHTSSAIASDTGIRKKAENTPYIAEDSEYIFSKAEGIRKEMPSVYIYVFSLETDWETFLQFQS